MPSSPSQSPWEFLIVCRDARVHKTLAAVIQSSGATANYTSDTTSALAYITRRKLDGIFIDTRTEGALSLVGSIRRGNSNRFAAVIATAGEDEDLNHLLNAGINFIVHRPLDELEIATVLRSASQMMAMERQRYQRHRLALPVTLKTQGKEQRAITANISRGGMAVVCRESFPPGSALQFVLELPLVEPLQGRGEVAWSNTDGHMGIRFYLMGEKVKSTLWHWMDKRAAI
jgi:hypothetical protein